MEAMVGQDEGGTSASRQARLEGPQVLPEEVIERLDRRHAAAWDAEKGVSKKRDVQGETPGSANCQLTVGRTILPSLPHPQGKGGSGAGEKRGE